MQPTLCKLGTRQVSPEFKSVCSRTPRAASRWLVGAAGSKTQPICSAGDRDEDQEEAESSKPRSRRRRRSAGTTADDDMGFLKEASPMDQSWLHFALFAALQEQG